MVERGELGKLLGEKVRHYRNLKNITQTALAGRVEVAPAYISQIEAGDRSPSVAVLVRLARELSTTVDSLILEQVPEEPTLVDVVALLAYCAIALQKIEERREETDERFAAVVEEITGRGSYRDQRAKETAGGPFSVRATPAPAKTLTIVPKS